MPWDGEGRLAAVTGATGAIGPVLVTRLLRAGYRVRVLARPAPSRMPFDDAVEVCRGDVCAPQAVGALVAGADVVFHLAARLHIPDPPAALHADYRRVNVEGTRTVAGRAAAAGVRRLVYVSTTGVYGPTGGRGADEDTPPRPDTIYGQTKLEGEAVALAARRAGDGGGLATVLRLATVYGPGQKGNLQRLVRALARGRFVPIGDGRNRRTLVYVRDAAEAMLVAAAHPAAAGRVFNVTDGHVHTMRDLLAAICRALGRPAPRFHLPLSLARAGVGGVERAFAVVGRRPPVTRAALEKFVEDAVYRGQRIQADLGFRPAYDLAAGWEETIAGLRSRRDL